MDRPELIRNIIDNTIENRYISPIQKSGYHHKISEEFAEYFDNIWRMEILEKLNHSKWFDGQHSSVLTRVNFYNRPVSQFVVPQNNRIGKVRKTNYSLGNCVSLELTIIDLVGRPKLWRLSPSNGA